MAARRTTDDTAEHFGVMETAGAILLIRVMASGNVDVYRREGMEKPEVLDLLALVAGAVWEVPDDE